MREQLTPANLVTTASLVVGFTALLVSQHAVGLAALLVVCSAACDAVDGALARRSGCDRAFGGQLDSLTDVVCFGVVPAVTLWWALLHRLSVLGAVVCGGFLVAGAWRLARFHLEQQPDRFVGLPIPPAGLLLMAVSLWCPSPWPALLVTVVVSALMVSTVSVPTVPAIIGALPPRRRTHAAPRRRPGRRPLRAVRRRPTAPGPRRRKAVLRRLDQRRRRRPAAAVGRSEERRP